MERKHLEFTGIQWSQKLEEATRVQVSPYETMEVRVLERHQNLDIWFLRSLNVSKKIATECDPKMEDSYVYSVTLLNLR